MLPRETKEAALTAIVNPSPARANASGNEIMLRKAKARTTAKIKADLDRQKLLKDMRG